MLLLSSFSGYFPLVNTQLLLLRLLADGLSSFLDLDSTSGHTVRKKGRKSTLTLPRDGRLSVTI